MTSNSILVNCQGRNNIFTILFDTNNELHQCPDANHQMTIENNKDHNNYNNNCDKTNKKRGII